MLFSVIIPVYNSEKFIRRCINSILEQTYQKFEVIVINDGSTDSTSKILENFSEKDARIKVYNFDNSGVTKARQRGVLLAKGDYILFVDADDTINKELLFNIWKTIEDFPNVEMVRFKARMVNDKPGYDHELYNTDNSNYNTLLDGITAIKMWCSPNKRYEVFWLYAIKRSNLSILHDCPNFKTSGDYAFVPILIAKCKNIIMINYVGYNYTCDNNHSLTHSMGYAREKSRATNFLNAYKYLIANMHQIEREYNDDFQFFYEDWKNRLLKKYNLLCESLKDELGDDFEQELKKQ